MMFFIWLLLVLGMTGSIGLRGGRRIPIPPRPKRKQSKKKKM
jgi:hypothetical protein